MPNISKQLFRSPSFCGESAHGPTTATTSSTAICRHSKNKNKKEEDSDQTATKAEEDSDQTATKAEEDLDTPATTATQANKSKDDTGSEWPMPSLS